MRRVAKVTVIIIFFLAASILVLPVVFSEYIVGTPLPPLQLPQSGTATTNTGPSELEGSWQVVSESVAGFRVKESFLLQSGTIVGRTSAVTGSLVISNKAVTSGSFQVDISKLVITINDQTNNLSKILDTGSYPYATFTLTDPVVMTQLSAAGQTLSADTIGSLTMNNITHSVTLTLAGRYDGSQLVALGSTSLLLSDWGIKNQIGIHDTVEIEFLVLLQRAS